MSHLSDRMTGGGFRVYEEAAWRKLWRLSSDRRRCGAWLQQSASRRMMMMISRHVMRMLRFRTRSQQRHDAGASRSLPILERWRAVAKGWGLTFDAYPLVLPSANPKLGLKSDPNQSEILREKLCTEVLDRLPCLCTNWSVERCNF